MSTNQGKRFSTPGWLWIIPLVLFFSLLAAARPTYGIVLAILALLVLVGYQYLKMPVPSGEDYERVYPKRLAAICVLMCIFSPHLFFKLGDLGLWIEFSVPLAVFAFTIFVILKSNDFKWKTSRANSWITAAIVSVLLSMVWGYVAETVPRNPRDVLAIKDPFYLFLMFIVFFQQDWKPSEVRRYFLAPFIGGGIVTVFLGYIQYMEIPGLNENFFSYWTEQAHLDELMKPFSRRIFSTFYSAGNYGIFLVFLLTHLMASFYSEKGLGRILSVLGFALAMVALFMTATKGSFIVFIIMIVIFPLVYFRWLGVRLVFTGVTILMLVLITVIGWPVLRDTYMIQRMQSVYESGQRLVMYGFKARPEEVLDETSIGRIAPWVQTLPMIEASPIFGYGPGKSFITQLGLHYKKEFEFKNPFESSYLQISFRFGLLGIIINLGLLIHFLILQRRIIRLEDCPVELYRVASSHIVYGLLLFLIFFNTDCIYNINLMAPLYASAGIGESFLSSLKSK